MIKHIVMWRLKDFAAGASREENAKKLKESLEDLKDRVEDIKALEVGINFNSSPAAFDVVLYSEFEDRRGLDAYQNHPEHLKIVDFVGEIRTDRAVVDYED
ncbi:MAG TPA: Dabb family protein [Thermodesulfobacteriota bacterium]|nr:Dabb family protein [Thermodesulfobacteriota bacterium]